MLKSWQDVYKIFEMIIDEYYPNMDAISVAIEEEYNLHKGQEAWEVAHEKWLEGASDEEDFD